MAGQVGLGNLPGAVVGGYPGALHGNVRHDALGLYGTAVGGEVQRGGEFHGAGVRQRQDGLHRALAETVAAHHHRAAAILQGPGHDLRGAGGAGVDQHYQRRIVAGVPRPGVKVHVRVGQASLGVDHGSTIEEQARHIDAGAQDPARVVAQIQHQSLQGAFGLQLLQGLGNILAGGELELGDADVAVAGFQEALPHAGHLDGVAGQGDGKRLAGARAAQGQLDLAALGAAHFFDGLAEAEPLYRHVVQLEDDIAALQVGGGGR